MILNHYTNNKEMFLQVKKLNPNAIIPTYGSEYAAGLDIYAWEDQVVKAKTRSVISTGIAISWNDECNQDQDQDKEYYMRIAPRSGLSVKSSIDIGAGVIDCDYRGEIKVCLINNGDVDFIIKPGDRIGQMILERINRFELVKQVEELDETFRGSGGFGSTGK